MHCHTIFCRIFRNQNGNALNKFFWKKKAQEIYLSLQISPSIADIKIHELYYVKVLATRIHLNDHTRIGFIHWLKNER